MTEELPPGWDVARLQSLVGRDGLMTDGDWVESKDQDPDGEVRLIQLADVGDGNFLDKSNRFLTQQKADDLNCTFLAPRDILISRLGEPLGKTCLFPQPDQPCVTVVDVHVVRPVSEEINREWLMHTINSAPVRRVIDSMSSGTTRKRVTGQKLKDLEVRVPPAPEQERIASKIDELFSHIEEGERALERAQKLVERYRQSVLKAAVTGELTRDWREKNKGQLESGEALLARILKARREAWEKAELDKMKAKGVMPANDKWKQKYQEPSPPDTTDLSDLPTGWVWASVGQIGRAFTGSTPPTAKPGVYGGGVAYFKPTDLDQGYNVREFRQSLTQLGLTHCHALPALSILVTCIGATIGKVGLARVPCATNQQINALVVDEQLFDPRYVYWVFASPFGQAQVIGNSSATTLPILNKSRFEALSFPVPSRSEQALIADNIERRVEAVTRLSLDLQVEVHRSHASRQSVLKAAFSGQLVAQDIADEPATALLQRLTAGRDASSCKPRRGPKSKSKAPA